MLARLVILLEGENICSWLTGGGCCCWRPPCRLLRCCCCCYIGDCGRRFCSWALLDLRKPRSGASSLAHSQTGWEGTQVHTHRRSVYRCRHARSSTSRTIRRRGPLSDLCRFHGRDANAAHAHAVHVCVRTARAGGDATGDAPVAVAAARGLRLGEDTRGAWTGQIVVVLPYRRAARPSSLDLMERCSSLALKFRGDLKLVLFSTRALAE